MRRTFVPRNRRGAWRDDKGRLHSPRANWQDECRSVQIRFADGRVETVPLASIDPGHR